MTQHRMSSAAFRVAADRMMTEVEWQTEIVTLAETLGWWTYHTHDSRRSAKGWPDLVMIRGDRIAFVEVKREIGSETIAQKAVMGMLSRVAARVNAATGTATMVVAVWRPSDRSAVEAALAAR